MSVIHIISMLRLDILFTLVCLFSLVPPTTVDGGVFNLASVESVDTFYAVIYRVLSRVGCSTAFQHSHLCRIELFTGMAPTDFCQLEASKG